MKFKYLGTAAAEGTPAFLCSCETCKRAALSGGKNLRSRSQALIDGKLLLDLPPDTYMHLVSAGVEPSTLRHCLITHTHDDHIYTGDLGYLRAHFCHPPESWIFKVYGNQDVEKALEKLMAASPEFLEYVCVKPFEEIIIDNYTITPLKANHGTPNPYFYMISDGAKTILYAHDTGIFPDETWDFLQKKKPHIDFVSMDCTEGAYEDLSYGNHMCLGRNIRCRDRLNKIGVTNSDTVFVLNHFSHNGLHALYDEFLPIAEKEGFRVSFDGMEIEI